MEANNPSSLASDWTQQHTVDLADTMIGQYDELPSMKHASEVFDQLQSRVLNRLFISKREHEDLQHAREQITNLEQLLCDATIQKKIFEEKIAFCSEQINTLQDKSVFASIITSSTKMTAPQHESLLPSQPGKDDDAAADQQVEKDDNPLHSSTTLPMTYHPYSNQFGASIVPNTVPQSNQKEQTKQQFIENIPQSVNDSMPCKVEQPISIPHSYQLHESQINNMPLLELLCRPNGIASRRSFVHLLSLDNGLDNHTSSQQVPQSELAVQQNLDTLQQQQQQQQQRNNNDDRKTAILTKQLENCQEELRLQLTITKEQKKHLLEEIEHKTTLQTENDSLKRELQEYKRIMSMQQDQIEQMKQYMTSQQSNIEDKLSANLTQMQSHAASFTACTSRLLHTKLGHLTGEYSTLHTSIQAMSDKITCLEKEKATLATSQSQLQRKMQVVQSALELTQRGGPPSYPCRQ